MTCPSMIRDIIWTIRNSRIWGGLRGPNGKRDWRKQWIGTLATLSWEVYKSPWCSKWQELRGIQKPMMWLTRSLHWALSRASSLLFTSLAFLRTSTTSLSIRSLNPFIDCALWTVLLSSFARCNFPNSSCIASISCLMPPTCSKNWPRFLSLSLFVISTSGPASKSLIASRLKFP